MKTEIEIFDVTETRNGVKVDYSLQDDNGTANVNMVISYESIENYIVENQLNLETFTNWKYVSLECDGLDERVIPVDEYLTENLRDVVKDYLTTNLQEAA